MKTCPLCGKEYSDTSTLCPIDAAVLERKDDPLVGETLANKYLIERLIRRGGMGAVYVGKHVLMARRRCGGATPAAHAGFAGSRRR